MVRRRWLLRPGKKPGPLALRDVDMERIAGTAEVPSGIAPDGLAEALRDLLIGQARLDARREHAAEDEEPLPLDVEALGFRGSAEGTVQHGPIIRGDGMTLTESGSVVCQHQASR
jgi:hypothetical protein